MISHSLTGYEQKHILKSVSGIHCYWSVNQYTHWALTHIYLQQLLPKGLNIHLWIFNATLLTFFIILNNPVWWISNCVALIAPRICRHHFPNSRIFQWHSHIQTFASLAYFLTGRLQHWALLQIGYSMLNYAHYYL